MDAAFALNWFAPRDSGAYDAANACLERAGVKLSWDFHTSSETGVLVLKDKRWKVQLHDSKYLLHNSIPSSATVIVTESCAGHPQRTKLGDVLGITGCYHKDLRAVHKMDGSVTPDVQPLWAKADVIDRLTKLQQEKLDLGAPPKTDALRRKDVLRHLSEATTPVSTQALLAVATQVDAQNSVRDSQWRATVGKLRKQNLIESSNGGFFITEAGRTYCKSIDLVTPDPIGTHVELKVGRVATSHLFHADLVSVERWEPYDLAPVAPLSGMEQLAYNVFSQYPQAVIFAGVSDFADDDDERTPTTLWAVDAAARYALEYLKALSD